MLIYRSGHAFACGHGCGNGVEGSCRGVGVILLFSPTVWAGSWGRRDTHTHTHGNVHAMLHLPKLFPLAFLCVWLWPGRKSGTPWGRMYPEIRGLSPDKMCSPPLQVMSPKQGQFLTVANQGQKTDDNRRGIFPHPTSTLSSANDCIRGRWPDSGTPRGMCSAIRKSSGGRGTFLREPSSEEIRVVLTWFCHAVGSHHVVFFDRAVVYLLVSF